MPAVRCSDKNDSAEARMEEEKSLQGIVLQAYDVRDSSRIVDLFTQERGNISVLVRGAKRNKSRFLNLSAPYVEGQFHVVFGRTTNYLKEGTITDAHLGLRRSLAQLTAARFGAEALLGVLTEGEERDLFLLFQAFLCAVENGNVAQLSHGMAAYLLKLCSYSGFRPRISTCVYGGEPIEGDSVFFDLEAGGMACPVHAPSVGAEGLSAAEYAAIVRYLRLPLRAIMNARDFSSVDARRLARISFRYYAMHTDRHSLGALSMMEELRLL